MVRQYAYFGMSSLLADPDSMTHAVGLIPDETKRLGSTRDWPQPMPRAHLWKLHSGVADCRPLDEHFAALLAKVKPQVPRIREFLASSDVHARFEVVRSFTPGPEDQQVLADNTVEIPGMERMSGQHRLLGFVVDESMARLAVELGVYIDFDEYGDEDE